LEGENERLLGLQAEDQHTVEILESRYQGALAEIDQLRARVNDYQAQMHGLKHGEERATQEADLAHQSASNYREDLSFLTKEQSRLTAELQSE
jgi:predicted  nucleic acid-binding Zn-ribbon protein